MPGDVCPVFPAGLEPATLRGPEAAGPAGPRVKRPVFTADSSAQIAVEVRSHGQECLTT